MKKLFYAAIAAILVLSVGAVGVFAAVSDANGKNYIDTDNDGVCDACLAGDEDGDGICDDCPNGGVRPQDGTGKRSGNCAANRRAENRGVGFVDSDGDGISDSCPNGGVRPLDGTGKHNGKGAANRQAGFIDSDGDGICDNNADGASCPRDGTGGRRMGGKNG